MPDTTSLANDPTLYRGVIPYINFGGQATAAAEFYARAFGAAEVGRVPGDKPGRLMHCQLAINGGSIMMTDHDEDSPSRPMKGQHLQLVVEDGELWWNRAVEAGCTVIVPLERMFWGDRWGLLEDPFGLRWGINEGTTPGA